MPLEKPTVRRFSTLCACRSGLMEWVLIVFCVAALCSVGPVFAEGDDTGGAAGTEIKMPGSDTGVAGKEVPDVVAWEAAKGPRATVDIILTTNHALFSPKLITMASPELSSPAYLLSIRTPGKAQEFYVQYGTPDDLSDENGVGRALVEFKAAVARFTAHLEYTRGKGAISYNIADKFVFDVYGLTQALSAITATQVVPRGTYNDGGRSTGAAYWEEASNCQLLLRAQAPWW